MKKSKNAFPLSLTQNEQILGWLYLALELLVLPSILYSIASSVGLYSEAVLNFVYYLLNFLFCVKIFRNLLRKSLETAGEHPLELLITALAGFAGYYLCAMAIGRLIALLDPGFANANDAAVTAMIREHPVLLGLGTVLLVPVAEECLFRGLLFTPLRHRSRAGAYAFSTAAFCLLHLLGYLGSMEPLEIALSVLQYIPAGLFLAWAYDRSHSLFAPILIHCAVNLMSFLAVR